MGRSVSDWGEECIYEERIKPLTNEEINKLKIRDVIRHTVWNSNNKSEGIYFDAIGVIVEDNIDNIKNKMKADIVELLVKEWNLSYFVFNKAHEYDSSEFYYIGNYETHPEYFV